jgi:hypothetical protein
MFVRLSEGSPILSHTRMFFPPIFAGNRDHTDIFVHIPKTGGRPLASLSAIYMGPLLPFRLVSLRVLI